MDVTLLLALVVLVLAGLGFVALVERFARDTVFGVAVVLGLYVLNVFIDDGLPPIAPAGVTITLGDISFVLSISASAVLVLRRRSFRPTERLLLLLFGLIAWSLARGAVTYGVTTAFNEGRTMLYVYGTALYVGLGHLDPDDRRRFGQVWQLVGWALVGIAVFRWAAFLAGIPPTGIFSRVQEPGTLRVIDARSTLMLVAAVMMIAPRWLHGIATTAERRFVVVGTLSVVLLQHRTVWVVFLLAGLYLAWEDPRLGGRVVAGIAAVAVAAGVLFYAFAPQDTSELRGVAQSPIESETLEWRVVGWQLLLEDPGFGIGGAFVGRPSGAGWDRQIGFSEVTVNPHNWFIQDFLRVGLLGLGAHLAIVAAGWVRHRRSDVDEDPSQLLTPMVVRVWTVSALSFGMLWSMNIGYGVMLGLIGSEWTRTSRSDQPRPDRPLTAFDLPDVDASYDDEAGASAFDDSAFEAAALDDRALADRHDEATTS